MKHCNQHYGFPIMTAQEKELLLNDMLKIEKSGNTDFVATYSEDPQPEFCRNWNSLFETGEYGEVFSKLI
jgi:hypothetical protein